jgi:hypothetical protein
VAARAHRRAGPGRGGRDHALGEQRARPALRHAALRPGPAFAEARPEREEIQAEFIDPPSVLERRLRLRIGEMIAAQVVEDEADLQVPRGQGLYHRYNAVLERVLGNKDRAAMTLPELEAALAWLERNRLSNFLHLLDGDARYAWEARQRSSWRPRTGREGRELARTCPRRAWNRAVETIGPAL